MVLITHILIALASVVYTSVLLVRPSHSKLKINYGLIAATVISGTYLVLSYNVSMVHACLTGLIYVSAVFAGTVMTHKRLARVGVRSHE